MFPWLSRTVLAACMILALAADSPADQGSRRRPFPLRVAGADAKRGLKLEMVAERHEDLAGRASVRLTDVPLPGAGSVDLELSRLRLLGEDSIVAVDGVPRRAREAAAPVTLWRGKVAGDARSFVFLAFSPYGSRGVIRQGGRIHHLRALPGGGGDWSASWSLLANAEQAGAAGLLACAAAAIDQPLALPEPVLPPDEAAMGFAPASAGTPGLLYEARIAVETDYQFFLKFGNADAAETYVLTLLGAAGAIYEEQCQTTFTLPYIGIHTTSGDPWHAQDSGGSTIDLLYEFRAAWAGGNGPVSANLYHFLSGANLGGGVAYLNVLCNQNYGFSVAGNINGGLTVPVAPDPAPWDLVVVAHELGHNFSSPHTHSFCPPLDQCAPSGYFGGCQSQQVCIPNGTIMSYCHLCPGGLSNIDLRFHDAVAQTIRGAVAASCLEQVDPCVLCVDREDGILVQLDPLERTTAEEVLCIANSGDPGEPVDWSAAPAEPAPWLALDAASGTVGGEVDEVTLTFDSQSLQAGVYETVLVVQNDAVAADFVEVPITFHVLPPPFLLGDLLSGEVATAEDTDSASFEAFSGLTAKLAIDRAGGAGPAVVSVLDPAGQIVANWSVAAGASVNRKVKLSADGAHVLCVEGSGAPAGAFSVKTKSRLPQAARPRTIKKLKPAGGAGYADVTIKALRGATLDVLVEPKGAAVGPLTLLLFDPESASVDLAAHLAPDGLSFSGLPLACTGSYRLRVSGFQAGAGSARVVILPVQPKGSATVAID
ncbi:MAG: zinc-dependent metalloprotease [Planctomycetes bacterium]|nr:zinc-dependent metalloprotease [Planctomycetota bacterium]